MPRVLSPVVLHLAAACETVRHVAAVAHVSSLVLLSPAPLDLT